MFHLGVMDINHNVKKSLSSLWRLLTSLLRELYHWCWFASCSRYIIIIIVIPRFIVRSSFSEVGIIPDRKCTAWDVEHSRSKWSVYIMDDVILYAAAFIWCNQNGIWCMYMYKYHVVVLHLDKKYAQCVHCENEKHGISHDWNVISYDEEWKFSPTPQHTGGYWSHIWFLHRHKKGL